ncbi:hypothetical protein [Actinomadura miaoliensis]|uniref:Uncharacterized protein n=1 Tax=Actinomadura miaoliensis TaxID=430685 RepID=A0ABP7WED2_9ACTN
MNTLADAPPRWVIHIDRTLAELRARFPGVLLWYGRYTGSLWSMVRDRAGRDRLVEAADPAELVSILAYLERRSAPAVVPSPRPAVRSSTSRTSRTRAEGGRPRRVRARRGRRRRLVGRDQW